MQNPSPLPPRQSGFKSLSGCMKVLVILGGLSVLGFGSCVMLIGLQYKPPPPTPTPTPEIECPGVNVAASLLNASLQRYDQGFALSSGCEIQVQHCPNALNSMIALENNNQLCEQLKKLGVCRVDFIEGGFIPKIKTVTLIEQKGNACVPVSGKKK